MGTSTIRIRCLLFHPIIIRPTGLYLQIIRASKNIGEEIRRGVKKVFLYSRCAAWYQIKARITKSSEATRRLANRNSPYKCRSLLLIFCRVSVQDLPPIRSGDREKLFPSLCVFGPMSCRAIGTVLSRIPHLMLSSLCPAETGNPV